MTPWKTIRLGTHSRASDITTAGCVTIREILCAMSTSPVEYELDLVIQSPRDLGFSEHEVGEAVFMNRAMAKGLLMCPPEVGPQLRCQYENQPVGEILCVATNAETHFGSKKHLEVSHVEHHRDVKREPTLELDWLHQGLRVRRDSMWVFVLPRVMKREEQDVMVQAKSREVKSSLRGWAKSNLVLGEGEELIVDISINRPETTRDVSRGNA